MKNLEKAPMTGAEALSEPKRRQSLFARIVALVEAARQKVATVANIAQVYTNYEIGRQIVEEEQGGKRRAEYGKQILIDLSQKLTARFGRGWSVENLTLMRKFFLVYSSGMIPATPVRKSNGKEIVNTVYEISSGEEIVNTIYEIDDAEDSVNSVYQIPKFTLSWSHYLLLMRIADPVERAFYEREAAQGRWSFRRLERMYRTSTFERLQISKSQALVEMFTPDSEKNRIFVKQYTSVLPSKAALKRIVLEEKRRFEREKLLALAAAKKGEKA